MKNQANQKLTWPFLLLTAGLSLFITAFITTTSPLFAFNISWDGNTMFTVGKGLWHGLMPYRDLFDQRGPLIYLMNSLAALLSYKTFIGVYLFEALSIFFTIVFAYKIINLRFSRPIAYAASFTMLPIVFNDYFFENGELPESLIMPMVLSLIYIVLKNNGKDETNPQLFWQGFALALVFWTKYSLVLPWVAFFGLIAVQSIVNQNWQQLFKRVWISLSGFLTVSIPLLLFYGIMGALRALWRVYFEINIKYYPQSQVLSIKLFKTLFGFIFRNWRTMSISTIFIIGALYLIFNRSFKWFPKLIIATGMGFEVIMIAGNANSYRYYFVGLGVYMVFLAFLIAMGLTKLVDQHSLKPKMVAVITTCLAVGAIFVTNQSYRYTVLFPHNQTISTNRKSTEPFQIEFAKIINRSADRTVLNYNNLDVGVYTATGTLPPTKYFAKLNLRHYSPLMDSQDRILNQHQAQFVIFTLLKHEKISDASHHPNQQFYRDYRLVAKRHAIFQNHKMRYLLYQLRS
ncbi:glycosyltransferase family 39 protein [Lactobacillaceae bacterium Scapto_B20]